MTFRHWFALFTILICLTAFLWIAEGILQWIYLRMVLKIYTGRLVDVFWIPQRQDFGQQMGIIEKVGMAQLTLSRGDGHPPKKIPLRRIQLIQLVKGQEDVWRHFSLRERMRHRLLRN